MQRESPAYLSLIVDAGRKDYAANVAFRREVRERCRVDLEFRDLVMELCGRDPLFFAATFACVQEPRGRSVQTLPFIPYQFQERFILDLVACWGVRHHMTLKSRTMGWTWMVCGVVNTWKFLFSTSEGIMGSSDADMVDKTGSKNTIMAKLDFVLSKLPWWMLQGWAVDEKSCRQNMMFQHPATESAFIGASTTEDIGRGGRGTVIEMDEFAKWKAAESNSAYASIIHTSDCSIIGSTPRGAVGAFHDQWNNEDSPAMKVKLHWTDHPVYRRGMYQAHEDGTLELVDGVYWGQKGPVHERWKGNQLRKFTQETYPFVMDGKLRSPWYDEMCMKCGSAVRIAQELDCDFSGSDAPFFDELTLKRLEADLVREPLFVGNIILDPEAVVVTAMKPLPQGLLSLWLLPDKNNRFPDGRRYAIGVDVSAGTKGAQASNSAIVVFDRETGDQVAEFVSNAIKPGRLADYAAAIGKWFNEAMINWENGVHGATFLNALKDELHYPNLYRGRQRDIEGGSQLKRYVGWWPRPKSKMAAFEQFASAQANGDMKIVSSKIYAEQRQFVWADPQTVEHRRALVAESPSERKGSHGDRVSAVICAHLIMTHFPVSVAVETKEKAKRGSLAERNERRRSSRMDREMTMSPSGVPL